MAMKHQNPTEERCYTHKKGRLDQRGVFTPGRYDPVRARAPYNFIPLPEKVVPAPLLPLPAHDRYAEDLLTGWIECTLDTCSPVYIRGMLTEAQWRAFGQTDNEHLHDEEKKAKAAFFAKDGNAPVLPGSSLRGMLRTLVEIVGYGRMRFVAAQPTFTFRAVAAPKNDPLQAPYETALGRFGANVRAGVLHKNGNQWVVYPARKPSDVWHSEKLAYIKVKEYILDRIGDFVGVNAPGYKPTFFDVSFSAEIKRDADRNEYLAVTEVSKSVEDLENKGILVCSGNMLETRDAQNSVGEDSTLSPRKSHAIILEVNRRVEIPIPEPVIDVYLKSLTAAQKEDLWGGEHGCLLEGAPVFYILNENAVAAFGHSPNFRIPVVPGGANVTPFDFVPEAIRTAEEPDFADAMFGWVEEKDWGPKVDRKPAYAGRVFVGDAHCTSTKNIWYSQEPITPHILASPKVTTFQHYLVQNGDPHHPDQKVTLAHYGTSPKETEIRGHKLYWHKGKDPDIGANDKEKGKPSQLTQISPVAAGVQFTFKIRFENLHPAELGALWWALTLPGNDGGDYRHKLGMGKPLGMGAVKITPVLHLSQRHEKTENEKSLPGRYDKLFQDGGWFTPSDDSKQGSDFIENFYTHMKSHSVDVSTSERIAMLLEMLRWRGDEPDTNWLDETRYMEIEHGREKINEYKERPVLPTPTGVVESLDKPLTKPDCAQRDKAQQRAAQHGNRR